MTAPVRSEVVRRRGAAADLHALAVPEGVGRQLWWLEVDRPSLVLGSTQAEASIDAGACRAAGIEVVRRRSGGGSVLMIPGEVVWLDVIVGRDDPLWDDDIGRAARRVGEVWRDALEGGLGVPGASVHEGGLIATPWSAAVCFAGLGPGELTVRGAKLVGLSQRRTRSWARVQCALHLRWRPDLVASLLAPPGPAADELRSLVVTLDAATADVEAAVTAAFAVRR